MRTLAQIMERQITLAHPAPVDCLDQDFDDMAPEESLFYEAPTELEEMDGWL